MIKTKNFLPVLLSCFYNLLKQRRYVFKDDTKDGPIKNRKKRIKEMDEVIKKDLE